MSNNKMRACFCIGPQNGDPVCPCEMQAHMERDLGRVVVDLLIQGKLVPKRKPRKRVPAGRRVVA